MTRTPEQAAHIRAIADQIELEPGSYDQGTYGCKEKQSSCGTAHCIAGWSAKLDGWSPRIGHGWGLLIRGGDDGMLEYAACEEVAGKNMGVCEEDYEVLFNVDWEPIDSMTVPQALRALADGASVSDITPSQWGDFNE